jgi:plasmid stabilization system protein ParE
MGDINYTIEFQLEAESDIDSILEYYNGISAQIADKFYKNFLDTINSLMIFPKFQIKYDSIRCILIKNFPYMIHYQLNDEARTVLVLAIINTYRNPKTTWIR